MQIHELPTISGSPSGGYFATDNGTQTTKIDYTALAQAIIEQYNASTLAGSAQSVKAALDGLVQKSLPTEIAPRTTIASNDDLNTYTTAGIYRCATATIAASLSNCPISNVGFNLDVVQLYNVAFAYQRITASSGTTSSAVVEVYERFINVRDSMYGTWKKVPTRAEIDGILKPYKVGGSASDVDDCNSLPRNSIGYTYANALNSPDAGYQIFTYGINDSNKVQLALRGTVNPKIKTRLLTGGDWSAWVEYAKQAEVDALDARVSALENA